ncbi:MAG: hypothetical protein PWQ22_683 [Archaeoglobaceae archaeon]|nr:hypothetical protein [Archaeoglobaceae archaeon]
MKFRILPLVALVLLLSTIFIPLMKIEFREMRLFDFAKTNEYAGVLVIFALIFTLLSLYRPKFDLFGGILLLFLFLFLSFSKMHSPEYLIGYWLLLASSSLLLLSFVLQRMNRKAY